MNYTRAYCQVTIAGPLNERWADYVGDMLLEKKVDEDQVVASTLIGRPADMSAYIGILNALDNLGLAIVATEYRCSGSHG